MQKKSERWRNQHLLTKFGITIKQWQEMFDTQGGVCAICKQPETKMSNGDGVARLSVDHCHTTGVVRGLLCNACNVGLHQVETRGIPDIFERMNAYLATSQLQSV